MWHMWAQVRHVFILPLDQQLPQASFAQFVVLASSLDDRNEIRKSVRHPNPAVIARCTYSRLFLLEMAHLSVIHFNIACRVKT